MITTYIIEVWNRKSNRYLFYWKGFSQEQAEVMMFKPYNRYNTRRLLRITEEVLYKEKAIRDDRTREIS